MNCSASSSPSPSVRHFMPLHYMPTRCWCQASTLIPRIMPESLFCCGFLVAAWRKVFVQCFQPNAKTQGGCVFPPYLKLAILLSSPILVAMKFMAYCAWRSLVDFLLFEKNARHAVQGFKNLCLTPSHLRDIYENPRTNTSTQVPRHSDVNELVARAIIKFFSQ